MIERFLRCSSGSTAIDYSVIAGLVSIVIIAACTSIGERLHALFYGPLMAGFK